MALVTRKNSSRNVVALQQLALTLSCNFSIMQNGLYFVVDLYSQIIHILLKQS